MTTQQSIATSIINQLGGINRLYAMVGIKDVMEVKGGVCFKIKSPIANYIKIELNENDLYNIEIGKIKGFNYEVRKSENDMPVSSLKSLIEKTCKVSLSL